MHPIVIIGSGMAGYAAAREFRKLNAEQELIMICGDDAANYAKPTLSNAYTGKKAPEQIALGDAAKMAAQLNMQIINHTWVKSIDAAAHQLHLENTEGSAAIQNYSKLILAVGANPIRLAIAGDGSDDIHVVNSLNDYKAFRSQIDQSTDKRVVILGAGLIGCEFANDLQNTGHSVTVIDLAPQPLGRLLPAHVAEAFKENLEETGIHFVLGTTVEKISKASHGHYLVTLANGQSLKADTVLSAIGLQPNIDLAKAAGMHTSRGILTNAGLETNLPDIYAMGDCAEVNGTLLPYVMPIMQQARALAKTLNGEQTAVHYPAMPVAVKTPAAPLTVLPAPVDADVTWETEETEDGMLAKATDSAGTLRGFVLLGAAAGKQRLALTKQVPDLIPASI
ncbi:MULTISPECIES: FAD-dependent oxidoreductase [Acinetobacter]|jgi:rubredoxin-NAD+ reductase|uniref:FAD-dependent oxidoreductase n=2 Tax=Acinetobacter TaxID=469 RepID=A0A4Q7AYF8_9GAMM|nr:MULTISPECIES: FAD-dependent oxidoreductase [Acinetobacter]MCW8037739.1 FAD-dependent oxidoreductase [Acinetobacter entericus]RZG68749.1 FAD-dependent oxidoreductase [Acinetobacter bouvetii]TCB75700.1 FAD-dependent oxidoreductase [Acinetobacter sp. ANC 4177]